MRLSSRKRNEPDVLRQGGALQLLYTGRTDNFAFAFAHKDNLCSPFKNGLEPSVPYDAHDELDDTGERQGRAA